MHNCSRLVAQVCLSDYSTVTLLFLYDWIGGMKKVQFSPMKSEKYIDDFCKLVEKELFCGLKVLISNAVTFLLFPL